MLHPGRPLRLQGELLERATAAQTKVFAARYHRVRRFSQHFQAPGMHHALLALEEQRLDLLEERERLRRQSAAAQGSDGEMLTSISSLAQGFGRGALRYAAHSRSVRLSFFSRGEGITPPLNCAAPVPNAVGSEPQALPRPCAPSPTRRELRGAGPAKSRSASNHATTDGFGVFGATQSGTPGATHW